MTAPAPVATTRARAVVRAATNYARTMPNTFEGHRQLALISMAVHGLSSSLNFVAAESREELIGVLKRAARHAQDDSNPEDFRKGASVLAARIENLLEVSK